MHYLIIITSGIVNIITQRIYFSSVFTERSKFTHFYFYIFSALGSLIINTLSIVFSGDYSTQKVVLFLVLNFVCEYICSLFFYTKSKMYRFIMNIFLITFFAVSEMLIGSLLFQIIPFIFETDSLIQDAVVMVCTSIFAFLLVILFHMIWSTKEKDFSGAQLLYICTTPLCSFVIIAVLPYKAIINYSGENHVYIVFVIFLLLNIINYYLFNHILKQNEMHTVIKKQEMQLNYQKEQYDKLESSFRETRRIIHEIKHRDGYLLSCLENEDYAKVTKELNDGMDTAYNHFIDSVSNNPVIDTFVTNYEIKAKEKGIEYETIINTSDKAIPLSDYDLCIIIGNLMDNCFNAAEKWFNHNDSYVGFKIKCLVETKEKYFVIYISNSFDSYMVSEKNNDNDHGYGIVNIQKIVNENRGFYHQDSENNIYETTISIPYKMHGI